MAGGDEIHCKLPKNYLQTIKQKLDVGLVQPSKNSLIHRVAYIEGNGQSLLHLNHISTPLVKTYDLDAVQPLKGTIVSVPPPLNLTQHKLCYHNFLSIITQEVLNHPLQNESPLFHMRDIAQVVFSSKVLLNLLNSINKMISEN
jgi:hypothetical protein